MSTEAWRKWKIPTELVTDLFEWQDGRCAMCGQGRRIKDGGGDRLVEDHCHMTGLVRGYLCRSCNSQECHSTDVRWDAWRDHDTPARALRYVDVHQTLFGHTEISPQSVLHYYTLPERRLWWRKLMDLLPSGEMEWPVEAPWTPDAEARRDHIERITREAFQNLPSMFRAGGAA